MDKNKKERPTEKELLSSIVKKSSEAKSREWLPAGFGEREKQLRMVHKLSQQEVADRIGTSVSTISRLENGMSKTIEIELISRLADLYEVSTDFLLGKIRTSERMYFSLKDIGLTPEAGLALYSGKADASTVNKLLEDEQFQGLTYAIKDYLVYTPDKNGEPIPLILEVCSDSRVKAPFEYCVTGQPIRAMSYAEKMHEHFASESIDALGDRLKNAVKEIRKNNESCYRDGINLTIEMMEMMKDVFPKGEACPAEAFSTPEYIADRILSFFAPDGELSESKRKFLACFRNSLISMNLEDGETENDDDT